MDTAKNSISRNTPHIVYVNKHTKQRVQLTDAEHARFFDNRDTEEWEKQA